MFRVYENRENIPDPNDVSDALITGVRDEVSWSGDMAPDVYCDAQVCLETGTHQAIVASLATALLLLVCTSAWAWIVYKKTRALDVKNR